MNDGRIEQIGAPLAVYRDPQSLFVADFVGETSVLAGERRDGTVRLSAGPTFPSPGKDGPVRLVVRPEAVRRDAAAAIAVKASVADAVFLGNALKIVATLPSGEPLFAREPDVRRHADYQRGAEFVFGWDAADQRVLEGGAVSARRTALFLAPSLRHRRWYARRADAAAFRRSASGPCAASSCSRPPRSMPGRDSSSIYGGLTLYTVADWRGDGRDLRRRRPRLCLCRPLQGRTLRRRASCWRR